MTKHGKTYSAQEYPRRLSNYKASLERMKVQNGKNPLATYAPNRFSDLTVEEFRFLYLMNKTSTPAQALAISCLANGITAEAAGYRKPEAVPASWDWRSKNKVTPVKDQGQCGSCWAFSATAAYEARFHIAQKSETVKTYFSEQQVVDCDTKSQGCNGGWMDYAFEYLHGHPFCSEDDYPYYAVDMSCEDSKCTGSQTMRGYHDIPAGNEDALLEALVNGPVSVAVDANEWSFYSGGIVDSCGTDLDHGVTLVKASSSEGSVTIRNSWSSGWGESGHIRLAVGQDMCGYADVASYPEF